jgi:hypothetical protein
MTQLESPAAGVGHRSLRADDESSWSPTPEVQDTLTDRLTTTVFRYVDVQGLADDAVVELGEQGLSPQLVDRLNGLTPTLASAVTGFVRDKIGELVASPAFASAWDQAIRAAHRQGVSLRSGDSEGVVIRDGRSDTAVRLRRSAAGQPHRVRGGPSATGAVP